MRSLLTAALVALALVVFPASAAAGSHWTDPTGDSGSAPDITSVDVSNDGAGNITFAVGLVAHPAIASDEGLGVYVDSDQNASTGNRNGADYVVFLLQSGWAFYAWNGSSFAQVTSHGAISVSYTSAGFTVVINKADLGGASAFRFYVITQKSNASGDALVASDAAGIYTYALTTATGVTLGVQPAAAARGVHPGSRFAVTATVGLSDGSTANADSLSCTATVGGKPLPRAGGCAWKAPKTARGKTIVVTVTVGYGGQTFTKRLSLRVLKR
jgi:hypothetical protein